MIVFGLLILEYYVLQANYKIASGLFEYAGLMLNRQVYLEPWLFVLTIIGLLSIVIPSRSPFIWGTRVIVISLMYLPAMVWFQYNETASILYILSYVVLLTLLTVADLITRRINKIKVENTLFFVAYCFVILLSSIPFLATFGFSINWNNFLFQDIYDVRLAAREKENFITAYTHAMISRSIAPILLVHGVIHKHIIPIGFSIAIILYLFTTSALKSVFAGLFIIGGFSIINSIGKQMILMLS